MKIKQTIVSILAIAVGLTSCEKDLYDPNQNKSEIKIENLKIADDFQWTMTEKAICKINADQAVKISIYQDEACKILLANTSVVPGNNIQLPLSIIKDTNKLYIRVDGETQVYTASIGTNGQIEFTVPTTQTRAVTRAEGDFENHGTSIFYPNGSWGTVMFEDNYPNTGDYDFNDFVATYLVEIHTYPGTSYIETIQFYMTIQAIGATYNYIPHLRIKSYENSLVKSMEVNKEGMPNLNVERFTDGKGSDDSTGKIVLAFNGAEDKQGQNFFNTEKGSKYIPGNKFDVTLKFAEEDQVDISFLYLDMFDIFLADKNRTKEIHMLGFGPAFTSIRDEYNNDSYYKQNGTNLVWGINIPSTIGHAYEKANFLDAYPHFANWAEGDKNANEWYKNKNNEFIFQM